MLKSLGLCRSILLAAVSSSVFFHAAQAELPSGAKEGGTLTILSNSTISSLNPAVQAGVPTAIPGSQLFASLLRADDKWQFHPYLADSWKKSPDGLSYTFNLNKKAVFHDGTPITSADVAFSVNAVRENHPFGKTMYANLEKVETPDPHTVVFKFSKPNPALLLEVSTPALLPILPKHVYDTGGPLRSNPHNIQVVGSGPFKLADYQPGRYVTLEKFNRFFLGPPHLDKIVIVIITDVNAATLELQRLKIQYAPYPPLRLSQVAQLGKNPELALSSKGYEGTGQLSWLGFNMVKKGPLQNVKVRQAISYAIDRQFITQKLQQGLTKPAYGPIHMSSPFYDDKLNHYDVDLKKANELLDEAGFKKQPDGFRFKLTVDYQPINPDLNQNVAEYLRPQLAKVGIKVEVRQSPDMATWMQRVANFDYDMTVDNVFNWGDPVIGVARSYLSSNIRKGVVWANMSGYKNQKVDGLLAQAAVSNDAQKRKDLYFQFQQIVSNELPVAWLFAYFPNTVYSKKLLNLPEGIWGAMAPLNDVAWKK